MSISTWISPVPTPKSSALSPAPSQTVVQRFVEPAVTRGSSDVVELQKNFNNTDQASPDYFRNFVALANAKSQNSEIDFRSSAEVAEYAQTEMGRILANIDYLDSALASMRDVDREMAVSYASLVEQLGEDGAKAFWQGDEAERKKRIDSSLDGINRMIGSVELSISVLQQAGYIIDGEVVSQREDGGLELGSFAVRFERQGFSAYFHTADRAPPADLPAGTRIEVLDGVVREITTLTTRTPFDPLPSKRLDITA